MFKRPSLKDLSNENFEGQELSVKVVKKKKEKVEEQPTMIHEKVMNQDLVERDSFDDFKNKPPTLKKTSFPTVEHRSKLFLGKNRKQKDQNLVEKKPKIEVKKIQQEIEVLNMDDFQEEKEIKEGSDEEETEIKEITSDDISSESDRILNSMSKEEIIEAQNELLQSLNPSLIEKLKKSGIAKKKPKKDIEKEKLEWMKPISKPTKNTSSIRYDFDGKIIKNDEEIPTNSGLYHHGEEPDKPGYTIDEIFHLIHSTVPSQRILCLKILKNIIKNDSKVKEQLFEMDIGSLLFLCIDDKNLNIVSFGLGILLLLSEQQKINEKEEIFMLKLLNKRDVKQPKEEEKEFKELCKTDILQAFLNYDLLDRISYFLNENIHREDVLKLLKILIESKFKIEEKFIHCYKLIDGIELQIKKQDEKLQLYQNLILNFKSRENILTFLKKTNLDKQCMNDLRNIENLKMLNILIKKGFCFDLIKEYFNLVLDEILLVKNSDTEKVSILFSLLNSYIEYVRNDETHSFYHLNSFFEKDLIFFLKKFKFERKNLILYSSIFHCLSNFYDFLPTQIEFSNNNFVHLKNFDENLKNFYMNYIGDLIEFLNKQDDLLINEVNYFKFSVLLFFKKTDLQNIEILKFLKKVQLFKNGNLIFSNFNLQFGLLLLKYLKNETYLKINLIKICSMNQQHDSKNFKFILNQFKFSKNLEKFYLNKFEEDKNDFSKIDWYYLYLEEFYLNQTISISLDQLKEFLEFLLNFEKEENNFISNVIRLSNILKVFFLKNEVYENKEIENLLNEFLNIFLKLKFNENIDHDKFFSFIEQFVNLYTFSSFGNIIFTKYLFLFFQTDNFQNSIYRKLILKSLKNQFFLLNDLKLYSKDFESEIKESMIENDIEVINIYIENVSKIDVESNLYQYFIFQIHQYIFVHHSYFIFDDIFEFIKEESILKEIFKINSEAEKLVFESLLKIDERIALK
eukprot:gene3076-5246_t